MNLTRSFAIALTLGLVHCAAPAADDETGSTEAAVSTVPVRVDASGSVFLKSGADWKQMIALQAFEPQLPGAGEDARISRNGDFEFIVLTTSGRARLKNLATGAVTGLKRGSSIVLHPYPDTTIGATEYEVDASTNLDLFKPADTGELTRVITNKTTMGTLPSLTNAQKPVYMQKIKDRLSATTYRGVSSTGTSPCELVATSHADGIQFEIYSLANGGRRGIGNSNFSTEFLDGGLEVTTPARKLGLSNGITSLILDESGGKLRFELTEVLGARRICKDLVPAQ